MQQNPILASFKIAAFAVLAFLVWITFWQGLRLEETNQEILRRLSQDQADRALLLARVNEMAKGVEAASQRPTEHEARMLEAAAEAVRRGVRGAAPETGPASSGGTDPGRDGGGNGSDPVPTARDPDAGRPPGYLSERAKRLWGRRPNYLEPDPGAVPYPDLADADVDPSGRIRRWYGSTPTEINPITSSDARVTTHIEAYCLAAPAQGHAQNPSKYAPDLAVRVEVNKPDHTEWVVFLRDDAYWHRPQVDLERYPHLAGRHKVTAHDIKFSYELIMNPDVTAAHLRNYYSECEGIEVVDDYCYVMRWRKPQFNSISFTIESIRLVPEFVFAYDASGNRYDEGQIGVAFNDHWFFREQKYVGCGPYFVADFDPSSHVLLRRNDEYFGELPPIYEIYQEIFPDRATTMKKLEKGELDIATLSAKQWEKKVVKEKGQNPFSDGSMEEHWIWGTGWSFIAWKNTHPIFKDPEVRRAMTMACDRERIRDVLELGNAAILSGPHLPTTPFHPDDVKPIPFDLEAAKALLAERGWKDTDNDSVLDGMVDGVREPFRFTATIPDNDLFIPIFEVFKEDLHKIGVEMELRRLQWKQFAEEALEGRDFACTALLWVTSGWDGDPYQIWHSSQVAEVESSNFIEFSNARADEIIEELRSTFEHEDRLALHHEFHRLLHDQQPYTFLMQYRTPLFAWRDRVGNAKAGTRYKTRPVYRLFPLYIRRDSGR